jgi:hypothetical protein
VVISGTTPPEAEEFVRDVWLVAVKVKLLACKVPVEASKMMYIFLLLPLPMEI